MKTGIELPTIGGGGTHSVFMFLQALLVLLAVVVSGCDKERSVAQSPPPPPTVMVAEAVEQTIPIYTEFVGQTEPSLYVEIRARVSGFLEERLFEEGTLVEEGTILYKIDARPYRAKVDRAKAQLGRVKAQLAKTQRDVARLKPLYEQNAASQLDYDNAVAAAEKARADLMASQAELEEATLELSYTSIKAPLTGLIGESRVDIGALVGPQGESLLTSIQKTDPIRVRFNMTALEYLNFRRKKEEEGAYERDLPKWRSVTITLPDLSEYEFKGDVAFTDPQVNPKTGSFAVRAVLPNRNQVFRPGQYTRVRLRLGWLPDAILVPQRAIQVDMLGPYVVVVLDNLQAEKRYVVVERVWEDEVVIEGGLRAGEKIIVEGMHKVQPGMLVQIAGEEEEHGDQPTPREESPS